MLIFTLSDTKSDSSVQIVVRSAEKVRAAAKERGIVSRSLHFAPVSIGSEVAADFSVGDWFVVSSDYIDAMLFCRVVDKQVDGHHVVVEVHIEDIGDQGRFFHIERKRVLIAISNTAREDQTERDNVENVRTFKPY